MKQLEMTMSARRNHKPWKTPDFEARFREAMGREMTPEEREFFGLADDRPEEKEQASQDSGSDRAEFAWHALRRLSALLG